MPAEVSANVTRMLVARHGRVSNGGTTHSKLFTTFLSPEPFTQVPKGF